MNKQGTFLAFAGLITSLTGAAFAQATTPSPGLNSTDAQYLTQNAQGSVSDHAEAEAALEKAQGKDVRDYAQMVYNDHNKLNMQLYALAHDKSVILPITLSDTDKATLDSLVQSSGADFDRAYLQQEIKTNGQDVSDARQELTTTTDPDVRKFVTTFLNTEQKHLERAQELMNQMTTAANN
jgi:putative membrane protein